MKIRLRNSLVSVVILILCIIVVFSVKELITFSALVTKQLSSLFYQLPETSTQDNRVILSQKEKAFIRQHPEIVLAAGSATEPFVIQNTDNSFTGHDVEIARLITQATGLKISIVQGVWNDMVERTKKREFDGLISAAYVKERMALFNNSKPYLYLTRIVIVKKGNPANIKHIKDLQGKRVALQTGNQLFKSPTNNAAVRYYDTIHQLLAAVSSGQVDYTILDESALYVAKKIGLKDSLEYAFSMGQPFELLFSLRNDWPELASIFNKGLASISEQQKNALRDRWFGATEIKKAIVLSEDEQDYLTAKGKINYCVSPNLQPLEYIDNQGHHHGMSFDILQRLQQRLGIELSLYKTKTRAESLRALQQRKCDLMPLLTPSQNRKKYLDFADTLLTVPKVVVSRTVSLNITDLEKHLDKKFAVMHDHLSPLDLQSQYPGILIVPVQSAREGFDKVKQGKVFAYIDTLPSVVYNSQKFAVVGIKIAGQLPETMNLTFATRNDQPLLHSIIKKGVQSLSATEKEQIESRWLTLSSEVVADYTLLWRALSVFTVILMIFSFLYWKLKKAHAQNKATLKELKTLQLRLERKNKMLSKLSITDNLTQVFNRHKLDEVLEQEQLRSSRYSNCFGIILIDVDHFKSVNDSYGHQLGDKVLIELAQILKSNVRPIDTVGRWGGEEFVIICPESSLEGLTYLAERLRSLIEKHKFPTAESQTISSGVAVYRQKEAIKDLLKRADQALYQAKEMGRNRVQRG